MVYLITSIQVSRSDRVLILRVVITVYYRGDPETPFFEIGGDAENFISMIALSDRAHARHKTVVPTPFSTVPQDLRAPVGATSPSFPPSTSPRISFAVVDCSVAHRTVDLRLVLVRHLAL